MVCNRNDQEPGPRQALALVAVLVASLVLVSACSSSQNTSTPFTSRSASLPSASATPASGKTVSLGTNNPAQGDCTTDTSEAATSVGSAVLNLTSDSFGADIQLQSGSPNMTYGVFLQQVPGSCPQPMANAGSLTTDATGHGHTSASVARVAGATTFYLQLVPGEAGAPTYTSDRISAGS